MYIYYVYAYLRSDFTPYYIGKGKGNRYKSVSHSVNLPADPARIVFLETNLSEVGALALERRYIRWYGRKDQGTGILLNRADGGEGNSAPRSKTWRENHSRAMTGRKHLPETIQKMKKFDKSYMKTEEYRRKVSEAKKGKSITRRKQSKHTSSLPCELSP